MNWSIFIPSVFVLYGLWYGANILRDILLSRTSVRRDGSVSYDMEGFLPDDNAEEVKDAAVLIPEAPDAISRKVTRQSGFKRLPEGGEPPLDECIKEAKKAAEKSAKKIRFS